MGDTPLHLADHISRWMRSYCQDQKMGGFVVGISGGVDSALASTLAARTGLPLLCLSLPIHQAPDQLERARAHIAWLMLAHKNVAAHEIVLDPLFDATETMFRARADEGKVELALVNTKSRLRLGALYYFATVHERLVIGTGNKVEQYGVGFFAKYGDGGMDLCPLGALTKTQVYALAYALDIDPRILDAAPTDGLWPDGRTDEDQIGASYPELEWAMDLREHQVDERTLELNPRQRKVLHIYDERHGDNRHKIDPPPICPIPEGTSWPTHGE